MLKFRRRKDANAILATDQLNAKRGIRVESIAAFLLPTLIFYVFYAMYGLFPFGNKHLLTVDLYHQYAPFLNEMASKLRHGGSFFFSWRGGLGISFFPLFTYYIASPLNLLTLFFSPAHITEAVLLITLLKIGLAGLTCNLFLNYAIRRDDTSSIIFSSFYALSNFVLAYSWNIMWMDTILLLPLAALFLHKMLQEGKMCWLVVTLALMLCCNYYSAFFAIVFLFLYALVLLGRYAEDAKAVLVKFFQILWAFATAAAVSFIVIYPTYLALQYTSAANDAAPQFGTFGRSFLAILQQLTILHEPQVMTGPPNIYAGVFTFLLLPYFFLNKKLKLHIKASYGALLAFLFISFYSGLLDFLWHGKHYPNSLNHRYAFVVVFLLITMAYEALAYVRKIGKKPFWAAAFAMFTLVLLEEWHEMPKLSGRWRLLATLFILFAYAIVISKWISEPETDMSSGIATNFAEYPDFSQTVTEESPSTVGADDAIQDFEHSLAKKFTPQSHYAFFVLCVMLLELLLNTFGGISDLQDKYPLGDRSYYNAGKLGREIRKEAEELQARENNPYLRVEDNFVTTVNDPIMYGSNGLSIFASTYQYAPIPFMRKLGFQVNGVNSIQYKDSTVFYDSLLGIKYVVRSPDGYAIEKIREKEKVKSSDFELYKLPETLALGFFINVQTSEILNKAETEENAFALQNLMSHKFANGKDIFKVMQFMPWQKEGNDVSTAGADKFSFQRPEGGEQWSFVALKIQEAGNYYLFWDDISAGIESVNGFIRAQTELFTATGPTGILDLGYLEKDDTLHFRLKVGNGGQTTGEFKAVAAKLEEANYREVIGRLQQHQLTNLVQKDDNFSGEIKAPEDGYVFVSTMHHPDWQIFVDNTKVEALSFNGTFMLIPVKKGVHQIRGSFVPAGFYTGLTVTLSTILLGLLWLLYTSKVRRKKQHLNVLAKEVNDDANNGKNIL